MRLADAAKRRQRFRRFSEIAFGNSRRVQARPSF
jgi:hypothetical protein